MLGFKLKLLNITDYRFIVPLNGFITIQCIKAGTVPAAEKEPSNRNVSKQCCLQIP
jgi:hypothetical protein